MQVLAVCEKVQTDRQASQPVIYCRFVKINRFGLFCFMRVMALQTVLSLLDVIVTVTV